MDEYAIIGIATAFFSVLRYFIPPSSSSSSANVPFSNMREDNRLMCNHWRRLDDMNKLNYQCDESKHYWKMYNRYH
jgi:hypothetical protein